MDIPAIVTTVSAAAGMLAGGGVLVARLTRIAIAVEQLVESHKDLVTTVDDHEKRLTKGNL